MKWIGNFFWFIFGGLLLALLWMAAGLLCCITIIGIPFGIQCFKIASFVVAPFGRQLWADFGVGSCLMNVIWAVLCGWELFLASCAVGLVYCVTIIGIPLGVQSFKLVRLAFLPFGAKF